LRGVAGDLWHTPLQWSIGGDSWASTTNGQCGLAFSAWD